MEKGDFSVGAFLSLFLSILLYSLFYEAAGAVGLNIYIFYIIIVCTVLGCCCSFLQIYIFWLLVGCCCCTFNILYLFNFCVELCGVMCFVCVCMCCECVLNVKEKNNKCVRLVTNFNPFPSYFTAYLDIYLYMFMVYSECVVDMCLFVIIMNTISLHFQNEKLAEMFQMNKERLMSQWFVTFEGGCLD